MQLPSRLEDTTLGDLLGELHRARTQGVLVLVEASGTRHSVHLKDGLVCDVQSPKGRALGDWVRASAGTSLGAAIERCVLHAPGLRLGDALLERRSISREALERALVQQRRERLEALFRLTHARVAFELVRHGAPSVPPLSPPEFLHGRPRRRGGARPGLAVADLDRARALALLGLSGTPNPDSIRSAYRRRVYAVHPDRHPLVAGAERTRLERELGRLTAAYRRLVA